MRTKGGYALSTHTLSFNANGTFELVNMPDWCVAIDGRSGHSFLSGHGRWAIVDVEGQWEIALTFDRSSGYAGILPNRLYLSGWRPNLIYEFIGDPDSGHTMAYARSP